MHGMFLVGFFCLCLCDLSSFLWAHFYCHPIFHFLLIYLYIILVYLYVGFLFSSPFPFDATHYEVMLESVCCFFFFVFQSWIFSFTCTSRFFLLKRIFLLHFSIFFFFFSLWPCFAFPSVPDRGTEAEGQLLPSALWWLPSLTSYVSLHLILGGGKQASCLTAWVVNALGRTQCTHASPTGSQTSTNSC